MFSKFRLSSVYALCFILFLFSGGVQAVLVTRSPKGALTDEEKRVVKRLLSEGERQQDIQALINLGRDGTVNGARISEVKQNDKIAPASDADFKIFEKKKTSYNHQTGLNLYDHERLIRAREAMILAVQIFNSPIFTLKTETFAVLANIAWTYLLHEFYERKKGIDIIQNDKRSLLLGQMIAREDCPLSQGIKDNLKSLKRIRDTVEHALFREADFNYLSIFQACCLNFDKTIRELFGEKLTLGSDLSFSLQFARMNIDQLAQTSDFDVPEHIETLDRELEKDLDEERQRDPEYRFRVVYTFEHAAKSKAHIRFVRPPGGEGEDVDKVLVKKEISDKYYPHKPREVVARVAAKLGRGFTMHEHTQAWKRWNVRPPTKAKQPENTDKDYCIYHPAFGGYTYSDKWVEYLVSHCSMMNS